MTEMSTKYNPTQVEHNRYNWWLEKEVFKADNKSKKNPYTIVIPPPNVTGKLHIGHAWDTTLQDMLTRYKRLKGFDVLYLPGMDHAGISTQAKVEAKMREEGLSRYDLGREKFLERAWEWKEEYAGYIREQWAKLGLGLDYTRERFTLDEGLNKAVTKIFVDHYKNGTIYRGEKIINWDPVQKTALSNIEVIHKDVEGAFYHLKYFLADGSGDYLEIATTRPETMLGDTGVAVNPNDDRYKHLIGKKVILPLMNREIPVVADEYVDMEFGTGVVKMTPSHDPNDFEVAKRTGLEFINIFTEDAHVNSNGGKYEGLERFAARKAILADLEAEGLLVGTKEHNHAVGHCYRCDSIIEPRVSTQWFVKMEPLAKRALEVVKNGQIQITPKRWEKVYYNWLENIRDWTISRQIWWGHRIPAYYAEDGTVFVARNMEEAKAQAKEKFGKDVSLREEKDVLDTWFSSALWPFSTLGWPDKTPDLEKFFPTNALVTGADILFFWVARMVMMSLYINDEIPFSYVYLHGIIRDELGRKMSKSLGNSPDPLDLIAKYGADAIRFSFLYNTSQGQDIHFSEKLLEMGSTFANKVWNASRFVLSNLEDFDANAVIDEKEFKLEDRWILSKLQTASRQINEYMDKYELDSAAKVAYEFFRGNFCDWYVEIAKTRVYGQEGSDKTVAQYVLKTVLDKGLRMLHPFMPFITEEIWQKLGLDEETIMLSEFPTENKKYVDLAAEKEFDYLKEIVNAIRNIRGEANVSPAKKIEVIFKIVNDGEKEILEHNAKILDKLANVEKYEFNKEIPALVGFKLVETTEIYVPLADLIDKEKEIAKLEKDIQKTQKELDRVLGKLSNEKFLSKAPKEVIDKENGIKEELENKIAKFKESIKLYQG